MDWISPYVVPNDARRETKAYTVEAPAATVKLSLRRRNCARRTKCSVEALIIIGAEVTKLIVTTKLLKKSDLMLQYLTVPGLKQYPKIRELMKTWSSAVFDILAGGNFGKYSPSSFQYLYTAKIDLGDFDRSQWFFIEVCQHEVVVTYIQTSGNSIFMGRCISRSDIIFWRRHESHATPHEKINK